MPELPKKKVGIVACSGEELAEGTVTRLAALKVLEQLRPGDTVTICLPLFLAGGEGDRAFARFYPTIAIDGCEKRCAARGTEMYSGKPVGQVLVTDVISEHLLNHVEGKRQLNAAGIRAVEATAEKVADMVDDLLGKRWDRRAGEFVGESPQPEAQEPVQATCSCGSGIPIQNVIINGQTVTIVALPVIFQQFREAGKLPSERTRRELMEMVKIYNLVPAAEEEAYAAVLVDEYSAFCEKQEATT
ncbi:MAG TPA: putative zinc-binding protein [Anaerolineales bacterium]|nr:putative zinc-binding protein [Anaerolineales bacterium]